MGAKNTCIFLNGLHHPKFSIHCTCSSKTPTEASDVHQTYRPSSFIVKTLTSLPHHTIRSVKIRGRNAVGTERKNLLVKENLLDLVNDQT